VTDIRGDCFITAEAAQILLLDAVALKLQMNPALVRLNEVKVFI